MPTSQTIFSQLMDFLSGLRVPQVRRTVRRQLQGQELLLLGPVSMHGLRSVHLSREPARYPGLPARGPDQALPPGHPRPVSRNTLANANQIARLAHLRRFRPGADRHRPERSTPTRPFGVESATAVYALDSTMIDLCLALFPGPTSASAKGRSSCTPCWTCAATSPVWSSSLTANSTTSAFWTRCPSSPGPSTSWTAATWTSARLYSIHQGRSLLCHPGQAQLALPPPLSRIRWTNPPACVATKHHLAGPTKVARTIPKGCAAFGISTQAADKRIVPHQQLRFPAMTIAELYRCRWQVELFFKWIKQHLRIKAFFGTTENAVKTQIWIAISVYVLVAIVKKRLNTRAQSLHNFTDFEPLLFEQMPIGRALAITTIQEPFTSIDKQLKLFD